MKRKKALMLLGSVCLALMLAVPMVIACAGPAPSPTPSPSPSPTPTPTPSPTPAQEVYKWRLSAGEVPEAAICVDVAKTLDKIREETAGRLDITPYFTTLGSWDQTNEMCMRGDIEMIVEAVDDSFDPRLAIGYYMPYLYPSYDEAERLLAPGGLVYEIMNELMKPLGYQTLGAWAKGVSGMTCAELPPPVHLTLMYRKT